MNTKHDSKNYPKEIIELSKIINDKIEIEFNKENPHKKINYEFGECIIDEIKVNIIIFHFKCGKLPPVYQLKINSTNVEENDIDVYYHIFFKNYTSIPECLTELKKIVAEYKLMDGKLCSPNEIIENNLKNLLYHILKIKSVQYVILIIQKKQYAIIVYVSNVDIQFYKNQINVPYVEKHV
jgi:hypothetical protein